MMGTFLRKKPPNIDIAKDLHPKVKIGKLRQLVKNSQWFVKIFAKCSKKQKNIIKNFLSDFFEKEREKN